jgi:hypothetical protein
MSRSPRKSADANDFHEQRRANMREKRKEKSAQKNGVSTDEQVEKRSGEEISSYKIQREGGGYDQG